MQRRLNLLAITERQGPQTVKALEDAARRFLPAGFSFSRGPKRKKAAPLPGRPRRDRNADVPAEGEDVTCLGDGTNAPS